MDILTVDELISHLTALKESGSISGKEVLLDVGYFGITHVIRHEDGVKPFVTLESDEINRASVAQR